MFTLWHCLTFQLCFFSQDLSSLGRAEKRNNFFLPEAINIFFEGKCDVLWYAGCLYKNNNYDLSNARSLGYIFLAGCEIN